MNIVNNPFSLNLNKKTLSEDSLVVFVSDYFVKDYVGGAELSTQALIDSCPYKYDILNSKDLTIDHLKNGQTKFWIFGNFAGIHPNLLFNIITNMNYSVIEYDYKFCKYRSPEKHKAAEGSECNCNEEEHGKIISAFLHSAKSCFFMSEAQQKVYLDRYPTLLDKKTSVLSSIFDENFFVKIQELLQKNIQKNEKYLVLNSSSWVKGTKEAVEYCEQNNIEYELINNLSYEEMLNKFAESKGFVYLPAGMDTCPRMVIEAKLLGCDLVINQNVQHAKEEWFDTDNLQEVIDYLYSCRNFFWKSIMSVMNYKPTISSYTTTRNCINQEYPFEESINSMLGFSDEVIVVDGGSTDGTWEKLKELSEKNDKIKLYRNELDMQYKRFGLFDGMQKALARSKCTSEFCWQMDIDEVVLEKDYEKIFYLCKNFPKDINLLALPVVEYWGSKEKVRLDITPWKWRLSRNVPNITHGVPKEFREYDEDNTMYAKEGTDGCDYIDNEGNILEYITFYSPDLHRMRKLALSGELSSLQNYNKTFQQIVDTLPSIRHYSWFNIERKIKTYKNYWQKHWESLYNVKTEDTAENNMFFDKPWSEVTDEEITQLAKDLAEKTGGHIFHSRVNLSKPTPHLTIKD